LFLKLAFTFWLILIRFFGEILLWLITFDLNNRYFLLLFEQNIFEKEG